MTKVEIVNPASSMTTADNSSRRSSIPSMIIPASKYSSTDTEFSDEDLTSHKFSLRAPKISGSGFSTSASSTSSATRRRRRRKRRAASESLLIPSNRLLSAASLNQITANNRTRSCSSDKPFIWNTQGIGKSNLSVPLLNSVNDLNHAIGRHRGISGSSSPALDATLFAMFYVTDMFDSTLTEASLSFRKYSATKDNSLQDDIRKEILDTLKKEIVYSLRISYFCPASKIVKLRQALVENYPLEQFQDAANFLDLLFSKVFHRPASLTYSDGSVDNIYGIHLESHFKRNYYQPSVLTVEHLLHRNFSSSGSFGSGLGMSTSSYNSHDSITSGYGAGGVDKMIKFLTVPYPALIIHIMRKSSPKENEGDDDSFNQNSWEDYYQRPVIPNLEIDLTNFISYKRTNTNHHLNVNNSWSGSMSNSFLAASQNSERSLPDGNNDGGRNSVGESRVAKGLKSAWKVMFRYLEDLTVSSSHHANPEHTSITLTGDDGDDDNCATLSSTAPHYSSSLPTPARRNNYGDSGRLSASSLSLPTQCTTHVGSELVNASSPLSRSSSAQQLPPVRMELSAVICMSTNRKNNGAAGIDLENKWNLEGRASKNMGSTPTYSVYCKAGKDFDGGEGQRAPWIFYQPRSGVAPQVTLIENFGKWIDSMERNYDNFRLYEVPQDIRRALEDSHVLIYKRIE